MKKKILLSTLKEFAPIIIVSTIIFISFAIAGGHLQSYRYYASYSFNLISSYIGYYLFFIPVFITMVITPLFAMNYRYSLPKADFYMSLPLKEKELKRYRVLTLLGGLLIGYTLSFIVFYISSYFNYAEVVREYQNNEDYIIINYNFLYLLPAYFISIIPLASHYFASAALFNQSNNSKQAYGIVAVGFLVVFMFYPTINQILMVFKNDIMNTYTFAYSPAFGAPLLLLQRFLYTLPIGSNYYVAVTTFSTIMIYINLGIMTLAGVGSGIYVLGVKDPSGEYSGKVEFRNYLPIVLLHVLAFIAFTSLASTIKDQSVIIMYIIESVLTTVGYYITFSIYTRSFKTSKINLIVMISNVVLFILLTIIFKVV